MSELGEKKRRSSFLSFFSRKNSVDNSPELKKTASRAQSISVISSKAKRDVAQKWKKEDSRLVRNRQGSLNKGERDEQTGEEKGLYGHAT